MFSRDKIPRRCIYMYSPCTVVFIVSDNRRWLYRVTCVHRGGYIYTNNACRENWYITQTIHCAWKLLLFFEERKELVFFLFVARENSTWAFSSGTTKGKERLAAGQFENASLQNVGICVRFFFFLRNVGKIQWIVQLNNLEIPKNRIFYILLYKFYYSECLNCSHPFCDTRRITSWYLNDFVTWCERKNICLWNNKCANRSLSCERGQPHFAMIHELGCWIVVASGF